MRRFPILVLVLVLALASAWVLKSRVGTADASATKTATSAKSAKSAKSSKPGILYALDAKDAVIAPSGSSLRLSMPADTAVTWFTDRPGRRAGSISLSQFAGIWTASGFVKDPPNAALLTTNNDADEQSHVVEMTKPLVSNGRVSFAIRPVSKAKEAGYRHTHNVAAGHFSRARLFIDDATLSPCPATIGPTVMLSPMTPTIYQCLMAPGTVTKFSWPSISSGYTLVTACSAASTWQYIPNYLYGNTNVPGPVCTATSGGYPNGLDPVVVSRGFSTVINPTDGTPNCPTPTKGYWSFGPPSTAPGPLRITVVDGRNLVCTQITMITTIKVSPTTTVY